MTIPSRAGLALAAAGLLLAGASGATAQENDGAMSLDRLYTLPQVIGTAPEAPVWSPDARWAAFLWNDAGYPFRDIWAYDTELGERVRLTDLGGAQAKSESARGVGEARWMASGERLVFSFRGDIHSVGLDSTQPQSVTRTDAHESRPRPAPGSERVAFLREGDLWVKVLANGADGEMRRLMRTDSNKISVERFAWSPGGERIAAIVADNTEVPVREIHYYEEGEHKVRRLSRPFPGDETTRRRIVILDASGGGEPLRLEHPAEHPIYTMAWSSSGEKLMVDSSSFMLENRNIRVYDAETGAGELHYTHHEPRQLNPGWSAAWAPDDDGLIILSDREGWYHLYHQRRPGGEIRRITDGEWEIADFIVDSQDGQIYFRANKAHRAERQIYRVAVAGGDVERMSRRPGTHDPVYAPDFTHAIDRFSNDVTPPDLLLHRLDEAGEAERVTDSPLAEFGGYDLADVRYETFDSHIDGTELIARVSLPADYDPDKRYPLIVGSVYADSVRNQWGGRTSHPSWGLDQVLVDRGYVLLNVNVRGSWGQGKAFRQDLLSGYGGIDIEDLESGVHHLIDQGIADRERVAVWGSSYGGLMTLMSLFKKPEVYAAGIAGAPASNAGHAFPGQMWVLGEPVGDYVDRYKRQSAYYQSEGLQNPLMIIHGSADAVVLYSDTLELVERMIAQGKMFELVTLPGGSHAWSSDSLAQARFSFHKMITFFDRHLKP